MPSIISINVNGLNDQTKAETIFHNLNNDKPDIVFMQETHLNDNTKSLIISDNRWKGTKINSISPNNFAGVSTLISQNIAAIIHSNEICPEGNYIFTDISMDDHRFLLINVYAPTGGNKIQKRKDKFTEIQSKIQKYTDVEFIIYGGDFNTVLDNNFDRSTETTRSDISKKPLIETVNENDLQDIWRTFHPDDKQFTCKSTLGTYSRLDRFYISKATMHYFTKCEIVPFPHSDHQKVLLVFDFDKIERGKGAWKMNTSILQQE